MSFDLESDLDPAGKDQLFWSRFVKKYRATILKEGWQGPLEPNQLNTANNWDVLSNVLVEVLFKDGDEQLFEEGDDEGIPGGADFASIKKLCGKYFVTGSYMYGGPYDSLAEAKDEAGL